MGASIAPSTRSPRRPSRASRHRCRRPTAKTAAPQPGRAVGPSPAPMAPNRNAKTERNRRAPATAEASFARSSKAKAKKNPNRGNPNAKKSGAPSAPRSRPPAPTNTAAKRARAKARASSANRRLRDGRRGARSAACRRELVARQRFVGGAVRVEPGAVEDDRLGCELQARRRRQWRRRSGCAISSGAARRIHATTDA